MHISEKGLRLIEQFEGLSLKRYLDSVGVPTIGYGTTASVVNPVPATCTQAQAEGWLRQYVERECEPAVNGLGVPLNQNQFDALCSLAYNCGPGALSGSIASALHAHDYKAAADALMLFVRAGGQVLQGLVNRRRAERDLFLTPWVDPDPHHYLRFDTTDRTLGKGHHGSERSLVEEYDKKRKRWKLFRGRLATLRDDMGILAARLETVMHDNPKNADADYKPWRHAGLVGRADGRRYV